MFTYSDCYMTWGAKSLDHHSTFETIVMKEELKRGLISDLDRFMRRKDFYTRVGRQWVRNYLLHGLPGTGKTSLVAAMAKYLNFDVYSLKLTEVVENEYDLRRKILGIMDNSIVLVEDIDCSLEGSTVALSQLLSGLAGFWSNGEARIVIFTTNFKETLDPTLLSRMEMKIEMGHCCFEGFKTLASNYLGLSDETHHLYPDIKRLIGGQAVTPGQVAEALMKSQDVDVALEGLVRTLEMKSLVSNKI
ncbi:AAA-ATPase [Cardamine amara subsp. amara]|uniref:AAA-ATPase n=1 Tax=Cardamine amara subsp. amara TaxID=228776 RepID=A0ABD1ALH5_CARAN